MLKSRFNVNVMLESKELDYEEEENIEEEEPPEIDRSLNKSEVSIRLSFLGKTANGDGYTYLKAVLTGMGLTNIDAITNFKHLQFLDVSKNRLSLEDLQVVTKLPYLILLHADKNKLTSAGLHKMKYLQVMIMNNNELTTVYDVFQPELTTLEVGFNKIRDVHFETAMPNIRCLDFRNNQILDIVGFDFPNLDSLYLANNNIQSLEGLEKLVNLRILHVRNNPIRLLDGFHEGLSKLIYINLRDCKVGTLKQIKNLGVLKSVQSLVLTGCPYMSDAGASNVDSDTRVEIFAVLPSLKRINKDLVTPYERNEAKHLILQWLEEPADDKEDVVEELDGYNNNNYRNFNVKRHQYSSPTRQAENK